MLLSKKSCLVLIVAAAVLKVSLAQGATPEDKLIPAIANQKDDRCKDVMCIALFCDETFRAPGSCCPVCKPTKVPPPPIGPPPTKRPVVVTPKTKPPSMQHHCKVRCAKPDCNDPQWVAGKCCPICLPPVKPKPVDCSLVRCAKPDDCRAPLITPPGECCPICPPIRPPVSPPKADP